MKGGKLDSKTRYDQDHPRIALRKETYERLLALRQYNETADGLVCKLLDFYEVGHK